MRNLSLLIFLGNIFIIKELKVWSFISFLMKGSLAKVIRISLIQVGMKLLVSNGWIFVGTVQIGVWEEIFLIKVSYFVFQTNLSGLHRNFKELIGLKTGLTTIKANFADTLKTFFTLHKIIIVFLIKIYQIYLMNLMMLFEG